MFRFRKVAIPFNKSTSPDFLLEYFYWKLLQRFIWRTVPELTIAVHPNTFSIINRIFKRLPRFIYSCFGVINPINDSFVVWFTITTRKINIESLHTFCFTQIITPTYFTCVPYPFSIIFFCAILSPLEWVPDAKTKVACT